MLKLKKKLSIIPSLNCLPSGAQLKNMLKFLFYLLYKLKGWKMAKGGVPPEAQRCVMIAAPHTSNWDLIISIGAFYEMKIPVRFTIKKEWFRFPFNLLIGPLGGIPIDRSPKKPGDPRPSMVEAMADIYKQHDRIAIMVTPEGTRAKREEWKTGFWHTAKLAGVPVCWGYLDYAKKEAGVAGFIYPNNLDEDMRTMMKVYKDIGPCHPHLYSLDKRYV
jgi:1-acyl-sn-glycerol-3-phosphate acyltransferase